MGIVIKQSIRGTFWSYVGVLIGFISTSYFYTNFLTTEQVGLIALLVAYAQIFGRLSLLGLPGVTNRLFPYFRDEKKGHKGYLSVALIFHLIGLALFFGAFLILKPVFIKNNIDNSPLFVQYLFLLIPMTVANMIFIFLDTYNKVLYNAMFGIFLEEFLQRLFVLLITIAYALKLISFHNYLLLYAILFSIKTFIIFFFLLKKNEIKFVPKGDVLNTKMTKEIIRVALFSLAGGLGSMIVFKFDKIIINQLTDLSNTGIYTIALYFGSLLAKPSQSLLKISSTLIADAWSKNDMKQINIIYYKSCLNQLIIGGFLFIGIWANIDNILIILGDDYLPAKWVIFFIGIGYLIDLSTGANGQIIGLSKYYRVNLLFLIVLIITTIGFMYLLIPIWGIVGAAIAIASAFLLNNLMRFVFLKVKFGFQPFNYRFLIIIIFFTLLYLLVNFIPQQNFILDIFIRGSIITMLSGIFFILIPISDDIQQIANKMFMHLKR